MLKSSQTTTIDYYNFAAADYFRSTSQLNIPHLWDKINGHATESTILDIGCGSGRDLRYFSDRGYEVIGVDISFNLIKLAHNHSNRPVALADMCALPFEKSFNVAWAIGSLLHIHRGDIVEALSEINRVLNNNSIFIASMKKGFGNAVDGNGRYFTYYQEDEWVNILRQANFEVLSIEKTIESRNTQRTEWIVTVSKPGFL